MDTRALARLSLVAGILVLIAAVVLVRRVHTEEQGMELVFVGALAVGGFLTISGLAGVLTQQPMTEAEEDAWLAEQEMRTGAGRAPSVSTAIGIYLMVLSVVAGVIVGVAAEDAGAGIQTFTFGLILGGVIWGLGLLLGYRPAEDETPQR